MSSDLVKLKGRRQPPEQIIIANNGTFPCDAKKESFDNITRKKFVISSADINDNYVVICTSKDRAVS